MKLPPVDYQQPTSVSDAVRILEEHQDDAKVLAGGQSLIPLLAFRLARPGVLVDLARIEELRHIAEERDRGTLWIGAMVSQTRAHEDSAAARACPLLRQGIPLIAHRAIRNRGTIGGSLAHADGAAELPAIALCLGAHLELTGPLGGRTAPADEFFVDHYTTVLADDELLLGVHLPVATAHDHYRIDEISPQPGDYARVGAVTHLRVDPRSTRVEHASLVVFGVGVRTRSLPGVEDQLRGRPLGTLVDDGLTSMVMADLGDAGLVEAPEFERYLAARLVSRQLQGLQQDGRGDAACQ